MKKNIIIIVLAIITIIQTERVAMWQEWAWELMDTPGVEDAWQADPTKTYEDDYRYECKLLPITF